MFLPLRLLLKDPGGLFGALASPEKFSSGKMKFINGAGKSSPILGTQTFVWPLMPPQNTKTLMECTCALPLPTDQPHASLETKGGRGANCQAPRRDNQRL